MTGISTVEPCGRSGMAVVRHRYFAQFKARDRFLWDHWDVLVARSTGAASCWVVDAGIEAHKNPGRDYSAPTKNSFGPPQELYVRNVKSLQDNEWGLCPFAEYTGGMSVNPMAMPYAGAV